MFVFCFAVQPGGDSLRLRAVWFLGSLEFAGLLLVSVFLRVVSLPRLQNDLLAVDDGIHMVDERGVIGFAVQHCERIDRVDQ